MSKLNSSLSGDQYLSLGVDVDENLSWNVHIDNIAKKIASGIGILRRSLPFVTFEVLSTIYSTLVQPYFDYCSIVWGNCNNSLATKLQKTSKSCRPYLDLLSFKLRLWFVSL